MKKWKKRIYLFSLILIVAIVTCMFIFENNGNIKYKNEIKEEIYANDFVLSNELNYYSLISKNKENILLFWSSTCPHCNTVLEYLLSNDVYSRVLNKTLTVCIDSEINSAREISKKIPVYFDYDREILKDFECEHIPTLFIVSANGKLISKGDGGQESIELINEFIKKNK
ncbi:TlpA family protein disulfide reductase [Anaerorhabdus sp.]|uniref:TlpA family protein disulfide reductase n=1 Tax=Anaerorhabdus sp. TaxID=1872524 RepID=UPI002FC6C7A0